MKAAGEITRRQFLWLTLGFFGILLTAPLPKWSTFLWRGRLEQLAARFAMLLKHQESAMVIGEAYLQQRPQEAELRILLHYVGMSIGGVDDMLRKATDQELKRLLQQRIQQDFAEEQIVKIQGWILSTTEARLYALTTILSS